MISMTMLCWRPYDTGNWKMLWWFFWTPLPVGNIKKICHQRLKINISKNSLQHPSSSTRQHRRYYIDISREFDLKIIFCFIVVSIWVDLLMKYYQKLPMKIHLSISKFLNNFMILKIVRYSLYCSIEINITIHFSRMYISVNITKLIILKLYHKHSTSLKTNHMGFFDDFPQLHTTSKNWNNFLLQKTWSKVGIKLFREITHDK